MISLKYQDSIKKCCCKRCFYVLMLNEVPENCLVSLKFSGWLVFFFCLGFLFCDDVVCLGQGHLAGHLDTYHCRAVIFD